MNEAENISGTMRRIIGAILLGVGVLVFFHVLDARVPAVWLALLVTLVGVFAVTAAPTAGLAMMGIGVFMLLRDFGIIDTPWLGIGFSLFLVAVGLYGLLGGGGKRKHDEPSVDSKTER